MASLTREQVRRIDRYAIEQLGAPGIVLMENASRGAVDAIEDFWGAPAGKRIAVVAGAGNNGGDGFALARHLANRGATVTTFLLAPEEKITSDAKINLTVLRNLQHEIIEADTLLGHLADSLREFDLVVDAAGGTGIRGLLRDDLAAAVEQINAAGKPVVALDIPTGLDCDTGETFGPAVRADLTVTFIARKKGFDNPASEAFTGTVVAADIGIGPDLLLRNASPRAGI
jgi:NAD(P)H-hydrate epimerase